MSPKVSHVLQQALALTEDERRELALELLESGTAPEIEQAWIDESQRRVAELDEGHASSLSNDEALKLIASDE
jgi:hypothetical protein